MDVQCLWNVIFTIQVAIPDERVNSVGFDTKVILFIKTSYNY